MDLGEYSEKQRAQHSIFEEFYSSELEWADIQVMDENEFKRVNENLCVLEKKIADLKKKQPKCAERLEFYDADFSKYIREVDDVLRINSQERNRLKHYLFSKDRLEALENTLNSLSDLRKNNWNLLDERTIEYSTRILWKLMAINDETKTGKSQFFRSLEKVSEALDINNSALTGLLEPTHLWISDSVKEKHCVKCSKKLLEESSYIDYGKRNQQEKPTRDSDGFLSSR